MRHKILGKTGLRVSELCLGTMTFGEDWGWGASHEVSRQIFDAFTAAGGNFIDTSANYTNGTAERYVGEFIRDERDYFVVGTKYSLRRPGASDKDLNAGGNHRKNMTRSVEASLDRLGTDYVDLLYLHMWDYSTPVEEIMRALDDLVSAGKVLHVGISDTPAWVAAYGQAVAELRGWSRSVAYQGEYNLLERGIEHDVLPMARELELSVLAFGLLSGGALTGKFNQGPQEETRVRRPSEQELACAETLTELAQEIGRTPSQVAINWVRQRGPNIFPVLGARRLSQIEDNLGALEFTLEADQMAKLSAIAPPKREFPHTFWNDYMRRDLVYGPEVDRVDAPRWPVW